MKKKKILLTLGIAAMMGLAGCGETPAPSPSTPEDPPVVVVDPVVTGITLKAEGDKTAMDIGTTLKFTATVTGEGDFNKQYTFSVDKEDIATISNEGVLTAKAEGSVVVTATAAGDTTKKSSITITVNEVAVIEIKDVVKDKRQHVVGEITALTTRSFVIDDGTGAVLVFTKTAPEGYAIGDVVSVAGVVTDYHNNLQFPETSVIKKTESTIETKTIASPTAITAASYDEMAETLTALKPVSFWGTIFKEGDYLAVKVEDGSTHLIEPTDVPDSISLVVGTAYNITGYLAPYYEKYSYNGLFVTSATVKPIPVTSITVGSAGGATSMGLNETLQMSVTIAPEKATNKGVTWSVDKTDVATIDENGLLTSVAAGTVVVTATAKDGSGVSGTKSIEVLQFKDPVVSLTLGEAPSETVLGDGDIDVTVTVAGESSTSNFNPAYTPTSSDDEVATVKATETGISIHPVAAGTVTITVKTTGTNADGEQLTKTIELEVLGEPKVKKMTVSEAMAWRPADTSETYTDKSQLVEITGICDYTNESYNYFYISDDQGGSVEGYGLFDDGTFTYSNDNREYSFAKASGATKIDNDYKGKEITIKGTLCYYKNATTGAITMEVTNGTYTVAEKTAAPTIVDVTKEAVGGTYEVQAEGIAWDGTVTLANITPATGYKLGSLVVDQGYQVFVKKSFTDNGDGTFSTTFKATNYNAIQVNFVPDDGLEAKTIAQALSTAEGLELLNNRNPITGYYRVTGVLDSCEGYSQSTFVLRDSEDATKKMTVNGAGALKTLINNGGAGLGTLVTLDVQIRKNSGSVELLNPLNVSADPNTVSQCTLTKTATNPEEGTFVIKVGDNEVTEVAPGTEVTVTLTPASASYKSLSLTADNEAIVTKVDANNYKVRVFGNTTFTATFGSTTLTYNKAAEYSFVSNGGGTSKISNDATGQGKLLGLFASGANKTTPLSDIVTAVSDIANTYPTYSGYEKYGLKFGTSSAGGGFTFTTNTAISRAVVRAVGWGATDALSVGKTGTDSQTVGSVYSSSAEDSEKIKTLTFDFEATTSLDVVTNKRVFILSVELYTAS